MYTPDQVKLSIDGTLFDSLEPLKAITTLIPQDPEIFENTIEFNITMDLPTTLADINNTAKLAGFLSVLEKLPEGLATEIKEKGQNFSGGQKQRLALTRGLFAAKLSSLILMDEPTSNVDLQTEKEILSNIIQAFPDTAMIVSLHRLHLLPKFDTIIMLGQGKIIAHGKTSVLLNQPGPVFDLWNSYQQDV
jgi:ABC-type bacteriocin/lantibiotic exporter with double-glycine peptidase domain